MTTIILITLTITITNNKKNIMIMINKDSGDHLEIIDHKNKEPSAKFSSLRDTGWNRTLFCGAIR